MSSNIMDLIMSVSVEDGDLMNLRETLTVVTKLERGLDLVKTKMGNLKKDGIDNIDVNVNMDSFDDKFQSINDVVNANTMDVIGNIETNRELIKDMNSNVGYIVSNLWRVAGYESTYSLQGEKFVQKAKDPTSTVAKIVKLDKNSTLEKHIPGEDYKEVMKRLMSIIYQKAAKEMISAEETGMLTGKAQKLLELISYLESPTSFDMSKLATKLIKGATGLEPDYVKSVYGKDKSGTIYSEDEDIIHKLQMEGKSLKKRPPKTMVNKGDIDNFYKYIGMDKANLTSELKQVAEDSLFNPTPGDGKKFLDLLLKENIDITKSPLGIGISNSIAETLKDYYTSDEYNEGEISDDQKWVAKNFYNIMRKRQWDDPLYMSPSELKKSYEGGDFTEDIVNIYKKSGMKDKGYLKSIDKSTKNPKFIKDVEDRIESERGLFSNFEWGINASFEKLLDELDKAAGSFTHEIIMGINIATGGTFAPNPEIVKGFTEDELDAQGIKLNDYSRGHGTKSQLAMISNTLIELSKSINKNTNEEDLKKELVKVMKILTDIKNNNIEDVDV